MQDNVQKKRVVIVEDEPLIGAALEELLAEREYDVVDIIDSVDDAVRVVLRHRPAVVLMDIQLRSYNDGIDAARRLRLVTDIPIVFLTAYTDDATRARTKDISNTVFLGKPLDETKLLKEMSRLMA